MASPTTATSLAQPPARPSKWLHAITYPVFDTDVADAAVGDGKTPWDVVHDHLTEEGEFDGVLVRWLLDHGCNTVDIGAFAKQEEVPKNEVLRARWALGKEESLELAKAYLRGTPQREYPRRQPDFGGYRREKIDMKDPASHRLAAAAWDVFEHANEPAQLFHFGDSGVWVRASLSEPAVIQAVTDKGYLLLHHRLISWGNFVKVKKGNDEVEKWVEKEPEKRVLDDMAAEPHPPLPSLSGVRAAPVFGPDRRLFVGPGYDPSSRMFVWAPKLKIPFVPARPTAADLHKARKLLIEEVLGDFPFDDDASRAHAAAAMLHPFVRPMIVGPTPIHLIDKPSPGTGGTLLADAISIIGLGRSPDVMTVGKLEDEWRFRMVALLRGGPSVVVLDNINQVLDSATLAAMVTAPDTFTDRLIRSSDTVTVPIRCLWLLTGNNVRLSHEMARRSILSRLDANVESPETRTDFKHPRLTAWVQENRGELVWAVLVVVQAWIAEGCPPGQTTKGSFESWAEVVGGILEVAEVPGFLTNTNKLHEFADTERQAWAAFVGAWWDLHQAKPVAASDLLGLAQEHLDGVLDLGGGGQSLATKWGVALRAKRGAVIGSWKITEAGEQQRAKLWRLRVVHLKRASGEPESTTV